MNLTKSIVLAERGELATSFFARAVGLLGRKELALGEGLVLYPCQSVHTAFMRFPIDIVFASKDNRVVGIAESVPPFRLGPIVRRAKWAIELPAGTVRATMTELGDKVVIQHT